MKSEISKSVDSSLFRLGNPWRVVIDLNEICNLQCSYCHIGALNANGTLNSRVLSPELLENIIRDSDSMKVFDVTLTGGEITLLPRFEEYLKVLNGLKFSSIQMITNGTRLTPDLISRIKDTEIKRVSISIDGFEAAHDRGRGLHTWKLVWKGLENLLKAGINVNVITVLGLHNIDEWDNLSSLLKDIGVRSHNISLMCRLGRAEEATDWQGVPENRIDEVRKKINYLQKELNDDRFQVTLNDGVIRESGWEGNVVPIHVFQDQNPGIEAVVKVDGRVLRNRIYGKNNSVGNVKIDTLKTIWDRDKSNRLDLNSMIKSNVTEELPNQYFHYDGKKMNQSSFQNYQHNCSSDNLDRFRIREESWGKVEFDTETFSIINIEGK